MSPPNETARWAAISIGFIMLPFAVAAVFLLMVGAAVFALRGLFYLRFGTWAKTACDMGALPQAGPKLRAIMVYCSNGIDTTWIGINRLFEWAIKEADATVALLAAAGICMVISVICLWIFHILEDMI